MTVQVLKLACQEYVLIPKAEFDAYRQSREPETERDREQLRRAFIELAGKDIVDPDAWRELREASRE